MRLSFRGKWYGVKDFSDASIMMRKLISYFDCGASDLFKGCGRVIDSENMDIARVSYNGRVWPVAKWAEGQKPLLEAPPMPEWWVEGMDPMIRGGA